MDKMDSVINILNKASKTTANYALNDSALDDTVKSLIAESTNHEIL